MEREQLIERTESVVTLLYQNKEYQSLKEMSELLVIYQDILQKITMDMEMEFVMEYLQVLKALVECYQVQDMLGMGDLLKGEILPLLKVME